MADEIVFMKGEHGPVPMKVTDNGDGTWSFPVGVTATIGSMTANAGTNLNTSLLALEAGGNLELIKADVDKIPAQGQALAAASMPVVLPEAQITTLTPPAAITNFANETGGNLAAIKTNTDKIPALGQALAAASVPVVLTAAQLSTLTPPAAITGFALETGGNLATIKTNTDKIPALGQALDTGSVPVVLTAAQLSTLTPPTSLKDGGPAWTTAMKYTTSADMSAAVADLSAAPGTGLKLVVTDLLVVADADMVLTLTEETTNTVQMAIGLKAGVQFQFTPRGKWKLATAEKKLQGQTSTSGNIYITVFGYTEA